MPHHFKHSETSRASFAHTTLHKHTLLPSTPRRVTQHLHKPTTCTNTPSTQTHHLHKHTKCTNPLLAQTYQLPFTLLGDNLLTALSVAEKCNFLYKPVYLASIALENGLPFPTFCSIDEMNRPSQHFTVLFFIKHSLLFNFFKINQKFKKNSYFIISTRRDSFSVLKK